MDLFNFVYGLVPIVILVLLVNWEKAYYKKHIQYLHYRSFKARLPVYLDMFVVAVVALLVAVPFVILAGLPHP